MSAPIASLMALRTTGLLPEMNLRIPSEGSTGVSCRKRTSDEPVRPAARSAARRERDSSRRSPAPGTNFPRRPLRTSISRRRIDATAALNSASRTPPRASSGSSPTPSTSRMSSYTSSDIRRRETYPGRAGGERRTHPTGVARRDAPDGCAVDKTKAGI